MRNVGYFTFSTQSGTSRKMGLGFILLAFLLISACGGPPQYPGIDDEAPALLSLTSDSITTETDLVNGQTYSRTLHIVNLSETVPATSLALLTSLSAPYSLVSNGCQASLAPLAQCSVSFEITPITSGPHSANLNIGYFDGLADQSLSITLSAQSRDPTPGTLVLSLAGPQDFGNVAVGGFADLDLILTNTGEQTASALLWSGLSPPYTITNNTCATTLNGGTSCSLTLRFSPTLVGTFNQTLILDYNDGFSPQSLSQNFSGSGLLAGFLAFDEGASFDFGITHSGFFFDISVHLRNIGGGNASSISIPAIAAPFQVTNNTCPSSLAPGVSCNIIWRFSPSASTDYSQSFDIDYFNGFSNINLITPLSGTGFANLPSISLQSPASTPSPVNSPSLRVGQLIDGVQSHLYSNAGCLSLLVSDLATGTSLDMSPTLSEGTYEFHVRIEDSHGNLTPCSVASLAYEYDATPPQPPSNIAPASNYTTDPSQSPNISWTASSSLDVFTYEVGLDLNPAGGNSEFGWTAVGAGTSTSLAGLALPECVDHYISLRAVDDAGLISLTHSVSALPIRYDSAVPTSPSNLVEEGDATDTNSATISWNAGHDACGVAYYEAAIGADTNGNNLLDATEIANVRTFTNIGNVLTHRFNGLSLTTGINHYTLIRTVDSSGRASPYSVSQPWIVYNPSIELPDMIVWLDANDPTTILDAQGDDANSGAAFAGTVHQWLDKSGSAVNHHFQITSGSSQPVYNTSPNSLLFDGANTGMTTANHSEINTATVVQRNLTVAFRSSADITSRQVLYEEGGNIRGMNIYIFNNQLYCGFYNTPNDGDGSQPFTSVSTPISINTTYFVTWVFDYTNYAGASGPDGNLTCYVNGLSIGSTTSTSRLYAHSGNVGLGHVNNTACFEDNSCPNSGSHFLGEIYEVMLFNNAPNLLDVQNVHTYLDNKWN
ncbi:MAG: choice-of-anchor D domain-containing protein [Bdellovibrionales bacterium]|nr:choice-of-anchor D domain-containing protein [Bdellovibrionales bacterium]